jgi:SAM-dependent methyltransferase
MNGFELGRLMRDSRRIEKAPFILERCRGKSVLDLGCIRHSAEFAVKDPGWLHGKVVTTASRAVGVDYLAEDLKKLRGMGFVMIHGDVTKPIALDEKFDLIFAGDIIEHLTNFDGFFDNCSRLLKPGGELIITTGNPFYLEGVHYAALKGRVLINPEHTCWMDPQALAQLAERFDYAVKEAHFVSSSWRLKNFLCETQSHPYDILHDRWEDNSLPWRIARRIAGLVFTPFYALLKLLTLGYSPMVAYSDYLVVFQKRPESA